MGEISPRRRQALENLGMVRYRVYGPDFRIDHIEHPPVFGQSAYTTQQQGWWREASSLAHAREIATRHGDGRYIIVRFHAKGFGAIRWERDRDGGQEIWMVTNGTGYSVQALT